MQIISSTQFGDYLGCVDDLSHLDIGDFHIWFGSLDDGSRFVAVQNDVTANVMIDEIAFPKSTGDEELDELLAELG